MKPNKIERLSHEYERNGTASLLASLEVQVPLEEALGIARQIADALEAAHEKGVVHRDLNQATSRSSRTGS